MKYIYILPFVTLYWFGGISVSTFNSIIETRAAVAAWEKGGIILVKKSINKYSQEILFRTIWGISKAHFSITTNSKWIITSVEVVNIQSNAKSDKYFKWFQSHIGKKIIGKKLKTLTLWAVGGASDITRAFWDFLTQIWGAKNVTPNIKNNYLIDSDTSNDSINSWTIISERWQSITAPSKIIKILTYTTDSWMNQIEITLIMSGNIIRSGSSKIIKTTPKNLSQNKKFIQNFPNAVTGKNIWKMNIQIIWWFEEMTQLFIESLKEFEEKIHIHISLNWSGQVIWSGNILNCDTDCDWIFPSWTTLIMEAIAGTGYIFDWWSWSGIIQTWKTLQIGPILESKNIWVQFKKEIIIYSWGGGWWGWPIATAIPIYNLTTSVVGSGRIISNPVWIDCWTSCNQSMGQGTIITLTAIPTVGNMFSGWSGDCSWSSTTCVINLSQSKNITANFIPELPSWWDTEQTVSYTVPGWLTTQVQFKISYDNEKILQSLEALYISGDPTSQAMIWNFNSEAWSILIGQKISDLTDVMILGWASLTTVAFRNFIRWL
jgi:hypothetical protein